MHPQRWSFNSGHADNRIYKDELNPPTHPQWSPRWYDFSRSRCLGVACIDVAALEDCCKENCSYYIRTAAMSQRNRWHSIPGTLCGSSLELQAHCFIHRGPHIFIHDGNRKGFYFHHPLSPKTSPIYFYFGSGSSGIRTPSRDEGLNGAIRWLTWHS